MLYSRSSMAIAAITITYACAAVFHSLLLTGDDGGEDASNLVAGNKRNEMVFIPKGEVTRNTAKYIKYYDAIDILDSFRSMDSLNRSTAEFSHATTTSCAPWIQPKRRKVLFVELHTWKKYYGPSKYKTGEYYMSATWDYALRENGFIVDRVSTKSYYERMEKKDIMKYHLVFVRDPKWHRFYDDHDLFYKVRPMYFFGGWSFRENDHNYRYRVPFHPKQILSAYPDELDRNTFMGYFPHNLINEKSTKSAPAVRKRIGLLYGKNPDYFEGYEGVIQALLDAGFELHTTCKDSYEKLCEFPQEVVRHGSMPPDDFAALMSNFSFMLGFKKPPGSPTPLIGLSYGVAFLNPLREPNGTVAQHKAMSRFGAPYSYIVNLNNSTDVVNAAEKACGHTFSAYAPPLFRVASLVDRMCSLVEDDSFNAISSEAV